MTTLRTLALAAALALAARAAPVPEPPTPGKADVRGVVTHVRLIPPSAKIDTHFVGTSHVEGKKEEDTAHAKASVSILREVGIHVWQGGKKLAATLKDIKVGCKVQVVFGRLVAADPVWGRGSEVIILESPKKK